MKPDADAIARCRTYARFNGPICVVGFALAGMIVFFHPAPHSLWERIFAAIGMLALSVLSALMTWWCGYRAINRRTG